jgi:UDP-3-O-[3-hydroxymyristoyl] glucosamine N-acyltransferase
MEDQVMIAESAEIHPLAYVEDGAEIGERTKIGPFCIVRKGARIGNDCKFTAYCEIRENVVIGDRAGFGSRCTISSNAVIGNDVSIKYSFVLTDTPNLEEGNVKNVGNIGDGAMIGANVTLMPGFSIGKGGIIGACSQVRSNVGDNEVWFGNPAKLFKQKT